MRKVILLVLIVLALFVSFLFLPLRDWFTQLQFQVAQLGALAPLVWTAIYIVATVLLIPASLLTLGAGLLFGLWKGSLVVLAGANLGALCAFLLARTGLRGKVEQWAARNPKFAALDKAIGASGFRMVFLSRLSPAFPFVLLNYLLGLTKVRTSSYVLANLLGMLPGTFLYVYIGTITGQALNNEANSAGPYQRILTVVGLLATIAVVVLITRMARKEMAAAEADNAETLSQAQAATEIAEVR